MEEWRNFVDKYSISNRGRIRNDITGRILKLKPNRRGYLRTTISVNHTLKTVFPHRLVALYFVPNPNNYPIVNHIDNNSENNNYWNLEWCTYKYNTQHAIKIGAMNFENNYKRRCVQKDIYGNIVAKYNSLSEAAKAVNGYDSHIADVCRGKRKTTCGYYWEYID